jgi:hypothetical protein
VSKSPLTYIVDEKPMKTALIFQVNLFNAHGRLPRTLDEAMERVKDIQFSSKQRFNTQKVRELQESARRWDGCWVPGGTMARRWPSNQVRPTRRRPTAQTGHQ